MAQYEHLPIYRKAFDLSMAGRYTQKAIAYGLPLVFVRQTGQYFGTVQMRLPQVKVSVE